MRRKRLPYIIEVSVANDTNVGYGLDVEMLIDNKNYSIDLIIYIFLIVSVL